MSRASRKTLLIIAAVIATTQATVAQTGQKPVEWENVANCPAAVSESCGGGRAMVRKCDQVRCSGPIVHTWVPCVVGLGKPSRWAIDRIACLPCAGEAQPDQTQLESCSVESPDRSGNCEGPGNLKPGGECTFSLNRVEGDSAGRVAIACRYHFTNRWSASVGWQDFAGVRGQIASGDFSDKGSAQSNFRLATRVQDAYMLDARYHLGPRRYPFYLSLGAGGYDLVQGGAELGVHGALGLRIDLRSCWAITAETRYHHLTERDSGAGFWSFSAGISIPFSTRRSRRAARETGPVGRRSQQGPAEAGSTSRVTASGRWRASSSVCF